MYKFSCSNQHISQQIPAAVFPGDSEYLTGALASANVPLPAAALRCDGFTSH